MPQSQDERLPGRLVVVCGCMFSGKTGRLIERLEAARRAGRRVSAYKHRLDARYDATHLMTHDGRTFPALAVERASDIVDRVGAAEVVGVDEAQFFGRALADVCQHFVAAGREVIVAGIDHDTWGQPFPPLPQLRALADEVEQRSAPCTVCGEPAQFHQRMVPVVAGQMVGGPAEYEPRCDKHFKPLPPPVPVYE